MGKKNDIYAEFSHLARLALNAPREDVEMYIRRVARRMQAESPELTQELEKLTGGPSRSAVVRETVAHPPVDSDSRLKLIRIEHPADVEEPIWSAEMRTHFHQIVAERGRGDDLAKAGLTPTKSALFVGPPGVGKTLSARWLAASLGLPLLTLDLSAVMSSFLGRTGGNLRSVTDYARGRPSVLLLDEFDAIAKRRDDATEIGELKRLVTVLLQEIETWPADGFLIAASNHPELLDPAVWRRFDTVLEFALPSEVDIGRSLATLLLSQGISESFLSILSCAMQGMSYSDIERWITHAKRRSLMDREPITKTLETAVRSHVDQLPKKQQIDLAKRLGDAGASQYEALRMTGVSRPTQRKHRKGDVA